MTMKTEQKKRFLKAILSGDIQLAKKIWNEGIQIIAFLKPKKDESGFLHDEFKIMNINSLDEPPEIYESISIIFENGESLGFNDITQEVLNLINNQQWTKLKFLQTKKKSNT